MLKTFVLLLPYAFVLRSLAEKVDHIQWIEHLGLCRNPPSYKIRNLVKTSQACKDLCAKDHHCLMVKYSNLKTKCWLYNTKSLIPSTKCFSMFDFYIKVLPTPVFLWKKELRTCKMDNPYKIWFIETAQECKSTCAEETKCNMVKYSPEERKCFFSSSTELKSYNKCTVKYDFYIKTSTVDRQKMPANILSSNVGSDKASQETEALIYSIRKPPKPYPWDGNKEMPGMPGKEDEDGESPEESTTTSEVDTSYPEIDTEPPKKTTEYPTMYTEYLQETTTPEKVTEYPEERGTPTPSTDYRVSTTIPAKELPPAENTFTDQPRTILPEVVLRKFWVAHLQLCLSVSYYEEILEVNSERHCRRQCEQQHNCLMVQFDPKLRKCWLCDDRKMIPKEGCSKLFDYYIKGRNECEGTRGKCHRNAACKTIRWHRTCQCVYGFEGDGWNCKDINECSYYQNLCGENARCVNTKGSYSCKCKQGFDHEDGKCEKRGSSTSDSHPVDFIAQWKQEHSAATSSCIISIWTLFFSVFIGKIFFWM